MTTCCEINAQEEIIRECNLTRMDTCLYCGKFVYLHIREKARDAQEVVPIPTVVEDPVTPAVATGIVTPARQHEVTGTTGVEMDAISPEAMQAIADFEQRNRAISHRASVAIDRDLTDNTLGEYPNPLTSKRGMYFMN